MFVKNSNTNGFSVKAWQGDAKTLLAFNFSNAADADNLAGFSIQVQPHGKQDYYLLNTLTLPQAGGGGNHATVVGEIANSSANAPFQKFRWLHVPGQFHQGDNVFFGVYTYTITPRYFDNGILKALDTTLSVSVDIQVQPYASGQVSLGFTRGFTQSQAFIHHFGISANFQPKQKTLLFDTSGVAGTNAASQTYTYAQEYDWSGFTARQRIFDILNKVAADDSFTLDVFAYDLNEPDILKIFLKLASQGRIRIILDNATLHSGATKPEDEFTTQFNSVVKAPAAIMRGKFGRFAHDKVFIVYQHLKPVQVLTGSTNFSVTGMYVNANHVLVFNNSDVATAYANVFNEAWTDKVSESFNKSPLSESPVNFNQVGLPKMSITFSPHSLEVSTNILNTVEASIDNAKSSVLFAVMDLGSGSGPVFPALENIHSKQTIFSYGISDNPDKGISLYKPGTATGVLVAGKPGQTLLPPPFEKERPINLGHQVHHKFVICDFNTDNPIVWCGSSNLALGGERSNGDNLLQIHDADIATVFAIEALGLVDHFDFRNAYEAPKAKTAPKAPKGAAQAVALAAVPQPQPAAPAGSTQQPLKLYDNDSWAKRYFDVNDLHCTDRNLFG